MSDVRSKYDCGDYNHNPGNYNCPNHLDLAINLDKITGRLTNLENFQAMLSKDHAILETIVTTLCGKLDTYIESINKLAKAREEKSMELEEKITHLEKSDAIKSVKLGILDDSYKKLEGILIGATGAVITVLIGMIVYYFFKNPSLIDTVIGVTKGVI